MEEPPTIDPTDRPRLASFVRQQYDRTRESWVLQAPERVLVLDETSKEILDLCDGSTAVEAIVARLAAVYDAPHDIIAHDVDAVLRLMAEKNFLDLGGDPSSGDEG